VALATSVAARASAAGLFGAAVTSVAAHDVRLTERHAVSWSSASVRHDAFSVTPYFHTLEWLVLSW
jgi:hypothetical protein